MALRDIPLPDPTASAKHIAALDAGMRLLDSRGVHLDSFDGGVDDDRLTAAMSYAAAQTYRPPILLGNRQYTFTKPRTMYHGFALLGVPGMSNAEVGSVVGTKKTQVNTPVGATGLSSGGSSYNDRCWNVTIRDIAFSGSSTTQWMGGPAALWCMGLRDLSFTGYKSILGSSTASLPLDLCLLDGWLSFNNSYSTAIHVSGSDNVLFAGTTNIDSSPAHLSAGGANGRPHVWLDHFDKSSL